MVQPQPSKERSTAWRRKQVAQVIVRLEREYPDAHIVLRYGNDWELLVAVVLSAQCTDVTVNKVTADLFSKYRTVEDYAAADPTEFEQDIKPTGFFRNKTKNILASAQRVLHEYGGDVPRSMAELVTLPGVARKTANIVLGNTDPEAFAADPGAGIAVDTHVYRVSQRLGLAAANDAAKTERELMEVVPRGKWTSITYLLIEHGRAVCTARKPRCGECLLNDICPSAFAV
ncbi:MAG: endonuclease III [Thermoleophilia bacterium]|nr:endonuclease III [Thermoleophilia bacterium]